VQEFALLRENSWTEARSGTRRTRQPDVLYVRFLFALMLEFMRH